MGTHSERVHDRVSNVPRGSRHLQGKHASQIGRNPSPHAGPTAISRLYQARAKTQNKQTVQVQHFTLLHLD
jgi:hypothetical protein